jgi:hypothetical protein
MCVCIYPEIFINTYVCDVSVCIFICFMRSVVRPMVTRRLSQELSCVGWGKPRFWPSYVVTPKPKFLPVYMGLEGHTAKYLYVLL